ncbi:MAG TPA: PRC-barrel domain-containing protein [Thermodesulfobacteriota bacterium]
MGYDPDATPEGMTPLSALEDYEIAAGSVDIRGFAVEDDRGARLGEVTDLLVDPLHEVVRFVEVRLAVPGDPGRQGPGTVRIPVEAITVDEAAGRVRLERGVEPGRRKPRPQPIARGPAVQGTGEASRERRESTEAGRKGARTVEESGSQGPDTEERR